METGVDQGIMEMIENEQIPHPMTLFTVVGYLNAFSEIKPLVCDRLNFGRGMLFKRPKNTPERRLEETTLFIHAKQNHIGYLTNPHCFSH